MEIGFAVYQTSEIQKFKTSKIIYKNKTYQCKKSNCNFFLGQRRIRILTRASGRFWRASGRFWLVFDPNRLEIFGTLLSFLIFILLLILLLSIMFVLILEFFLFFIILFFKINIILLNLFRFLLIFFIHFILCKIRFRFFSEFLGFFFLFDKFRQKTFNKNTNRGFNSWMKNVF